MSAYIVEDITINRILSYLAKDDGWIKQKLKSFGFDIDTDEGLEQLGRAFLLMNIDAVGQRYDGNNEYMSILAGFKVKKVVTGKIQAYKAATCLSYQCSEGDVIESPLYKLLDIILNDLGNAIIRELPEYKKASWG